MPLPPNTDRYDLQKMLGNPYDYRFLHDRYKIQNSRGNPDKTWPGAVWYILIFVTIAIVSRNLRKVVCIWSLQSESPHSERSRLHAISTIAELFLSAILVIIRHFFVVHYGTLVHSGGTLASWLARWTPVRVVVPWILAVDIVLCSWVRHSQCLSPPRFINGYR